MGIIRLIHNNAVFEQDCDVGWHHDCICEIVCTFFQCQRAAAFCRHIVEVGPDRQIMFRIFIVGRRFHILILIWLGAGG